MKKDKRYLLIVAIFTLTIVADSIYILVNSFNVSKFAMIGFIVLYVVYMIFILGSVRVRLKEGTLITRDDKDKEDN